MTNPQEEKLISQLTSTGNYRIIKRFEPVESYCTTSDNETRTGLYLDTETTGMDPDEDKIIELAMVPFEYDAEGNIHRLLTPYNAFQDPGMAIPEIITEITGITDDMVAGQSIDLDKVGELLSSAVLVIAHNARFDRPFVETLHHGFKDISWACSIADIEWNAEGIEGVKLEYLAYKYGFFYEGHRATIDCQAGIEILSRTLPKSGERVLKRLLSNARKTDVRIWAEGAPFEKKDELKKRGYRWSPGEKGKRKSWYRDLSEEQVDEELIYLKNNIYLGSIDSLPMDRFNAKIRYSNRI